jgi:hypothetical protein
MRVEGSVLARTPITLMRTVFMSMFPLVVILVVILASFQQPTNVFDQFELADRE